MDGRREATISGTPSPCIWQESRHGTRGLFAFKTLGEYEETWRGIDSSITVPIFGFQFAGGLEPINVNTDRMIQMFQGGMKELGEILGQILEPGTLDMLTSASGSNPFFLDDELWTRIVYDYAVAWHKRVMNRDHIMKTLTPLYLGKVASLVIELANSDSSQVEGRLESLCGVFERLKPYLADRWRQER